MSITRVTGQQLYVDSQTAIAQTKARLSTLQQQASTGLAITKPSDDPVGAATVLRLRSDIAANAQYATNVTDGLGWVSTVDSAMTAAEGVVRKARDLTIQAANGSNSAASREAIAVQLESLKQDLLGQANTNYLGRSVFAGTSDAATAFTADGTYNGYPAGSTVVAPVQRRISATESVTVSADGAAAFGTPGTPAVGTTPAVQGTSVFETIDRIVAALRDPAYDTATTSSATVTAGIDDLKGSLDRLTDQHAVVGNAYSRIQDAKTRVGDRSTLLEQQRSDVQDVETTKVLLDLKTQELAYQTSLAVTAQVLQPTLMSFLQ